MSDEPGLLGGRSPVPTGAGRPGRRNAVGASLALRLVLFAVTLASLAAAGVGILSYGRARRALEHEAATRLRILAHDAADDLHRELAGRIADVTSWAQLDVMRAIKIHDVDQELADLLRRLLTGRAVYRAIACVDVGGQIVASAGDVGSVRRTDRPDRPRVAVLATPAGVERQLQIDAPIPDPDRDGVTIGTLVTVVDARQLLPTIEEMVRTRRQHAAVTVRTATGIEVIATPGRPAGTARSSDDPDLRGGTRVPPLQAVEAPRFDVTVTEPARIALAPADALRAALLRTAGVAILVASLLGALVALWIGRPIARLTRAVQRISESGELELPADVPSTGEVGVLATAFGRTLATVREQQAELLAQSRLATLGEIAASVAHEVRTPLSVLKTSAQLLGRPDLPAAEQRQLSGLMSAEVDRLNRVVTDLVDLARPRPVEYRVEPLRAVIDRALRLFGAAAERRTIALRLEAGGDPLPVRASRDQLQQVFVNLLHNALQATPDGGHVTVSAQPVGARVQVVIEDSGGGFPPEVLAHVFTRFRTTKPDGTGLGLVISKRLIEEHGGRIVADNLPGSGARVTIWLPRATEAA